MILNRILKNKIEAVLIDLSGTIHIDDTAIPGAIQAINKLRTNHVPVVFATNTTKESKSHLLSKLRSIGFSIDDNQVFSSLIATNRLIEKSKFKPYLVVEHAALDDFQDTCDLNRPLDQCDSLVVGLAPEKFNYECMNQYFRHLIDGKKTLIAVHRSRYFQSKKGLSLGPGPFVTALECASGVKAVTVGKPEPFFFQQAIEQMGNYPLENVAMIGDDVRDDVEGAQKAGLIGMLVKTGKYQPKDELKTGSVPNYVFESIVEAVDFILSHNQQFN